MPPMLLVRDVEAPLKLAECSVCRAWVVRFPVPRGGVIEVNPDPSPAGNLRVDHLGEAVVIRKGDKVGPGEGPFVPHFRTCAGTKKHRGPR